MACYQCDFPVASGDGEWCGKCWSLIKSGGFYWDNDEADRALGLIDEESETP